MKGLTAGERIEDLIKERGGTITGDAEKIGTSQCTISDFINGKRSSIRSDTLKKMCEYYNVSADYLLCLSDSKSRNESIQGVCTYTGLSEILVAKVHVEREIGSDKIQGFLNLFAESDKIAELSEAIRKYKSFLEFPQKCFCDIDGDTVEMDMRSIMKSFINDLFWSIIDGGTNNG